MPLFLLLNLASSLALTPLTFFLSSMDSMHTAFQPLPTKIFTIFLSSRVTHLIEAIY